MLNHIFSYYIVYILSWTLFSDNVMDKLSISTTFLFNQERWELMNKYTKNTDRVCTSFLDENSAGYVVEYRGNFNEQISKIDYACGNTITNTLAIVSVNPANLNRLRKDVPAIIFIEFRSIFTLQDIAPSNVDSISEIKKNPYLNLNGSNTLVGMIDTGIDYLNKEFINEDGTSRIYCIWDQTIPTSREELYIGNTYYNADINNAIKASTEGKDPYSVVPSKDDEYHGTQMASIIGAKGYIPDIEGIAPNCEFIIVKLLPSPSYQKHLKLNNIPPFPVYNNSEVLSGVEFLRTTALKLKKPMVVFLGVGSPDGAHDGSSITSRYLSSIANQRGLILVAGTGNDGNTDSHVSGILSESNNSEKVELLIPRDMKNINFNIWVKKPNRVFTTIVAPSGERYDFNLPGIQSYDTKKFYLTNTTLTVTNYDPEYYTGHQVITLDFTDIKPGIWQILLTGKYIVDGRYDIWLPPSKSLPEGTKFLSPNPYTTLTIPSTSTRVISVSYYNSATNSLLASPGKGFTENNYLKPDIATSGINILATGKTGEISTVSGSCAATAVVVGTCSLLLQWSIVDNNDPAMYSIKMRSYLIYGADRPEIFKYPNEDLGFGFLNLYNIFQVLSNNFRSFHDSSYIVYSIDHLFVRLPKALKYLERRKLLYE